MAVLVNNLRPNELFRYLHVRGPQKKEEEQIPVFFAENIYETLPPADITTIQGSMETLHPKLIPFIGTPKQLQDQLAAVNAYKQSAEYIKKPEDYAKRYPEATKFLAWLDANISVTKFKDVENKFKDIFGKTPGNYVSSMEFKKAMCVFWDNLFASLFSADNAFLVTLACKYIDGLHMAQVMAALQQNELKKYDPRIVYVYHAKPLVPRWFYELAVSIDSKPDEGTGDQVPTPNPDILTPRYNDLKNAVTEVRVYISKKEESQKQKVRGVVSDVDKITRDISARSFTEQNDEYAEIYDTFKALKNPYELPRGEDAGFSEKTKNILKEFFGEPDILSLEQVLLKLLSETDSILSELGSHNKDFSVRVGNSIMSQKDLCVEMIDKDPCAVLPRKDFKTKGSFMNSALIGDLLLTQQQLVKYDAGEVAHVEAVMQGLDKERVHRRLNRTETFSSFTRESTNETERETQTTERFSMEKETANAVQQNFQIDAGVNVSANYGVTNVVSSLDASYGYSQQQSQATATSFSRDVTERALFRVKELVRETQTVTVINEVEETSTHKLANNTPDHVNGVYRWLDKFYLNKIENYGRRLMFEFTIPEPANFYIFRKLVKPQPGSIVENPTHPAEISGPDGFTLTSPAVLSDTNVAFWVSQYDVPNVNAAPQEYKYFSRSWKNEYPTRQSGDQYDSFASEITIEKDYEAISANIYAENYWWGGYNIHGAVGTAYFGKGSYNNLPLSNIRNTVAIAMLSQGMNFRLNAVIKCKRSDELYLNWKIDTYNKIISAYNSKKQAYEDWLSGQTNDISFGFVNEGSNNPGINREIEREELKKRCIEMFTGQRYESFDAATNGILNVSGYPEILFNEAIREGNVVKFFEQAFEWENMTYIFYPYYWGKKVNWMSLKNAEDPADPLFTKFLQAGYARVMVPARPDFENYLLMFNMLSNAVSALGCAWNFSPDLFGSLGISNEFSPGINDPVYLSVTEELIEAAGWSIEDPNPVLVGHYVQKIPTNLVYIIPNSLAPNTPLPGLPDNSADPEIQPYI